MEAFVPRNFNFSVLFYIICNWANLLQVLGSSSDPSEQSFSLSQRHSIGMQRPVLHLNSDEVHVRLSANKRILH